MKLYDKNSNQQIDYDIPVKFKKIAINCSGGADSSILLFLTVKYLIENKRNDVELNVLTCSNDFKHRWNGRKAANVINYVIDKTDFKNFNMHYVYYRDKQDEKYFNEVEFDLFQDKKIDLVISGLTANPPYKTFVENINGETINLDDKALPERNSINQPTWMVTDNMYWYTPFRNVNKKFISFLYKEFNIEDMIDMTRSCESVPKSDQKYNKNFEEQPCGKCWWCLERKWAFGKF